MTDLSFDLVKCPNYVVCEKRCPQIVLDYHSGVCLDCNFLFGKWSGGKGILKLLEDLECCICFENKICVTQPKCDHFICVDCFKVCYFGKNRVDLPEPVFPYPDDIKEEYLNDLQHPKWDEDENIKQYLNDLEVWYRETLRVNLSQNYLKCCALCRK